ncbi:hypothetical protein [Streptomyces sp. NPDC049555]|uniref:hypothetical protein n=1 Tax=Streptomyces sp. NPDC049555 TaxID=3154930 RepID=UPI0034474CF9
MNPATAGLIGAVIGALIAGSAATFGPLLLQRRKEQADERQRSKDETTRKIDLVNDVGVRCRAWLLYLVRVLQDRQAGRTVDLVKFDEQCAELRSAAEQALAQATHAGYKLSTSGLADALRETENQVRVALLLPARAEDLARLRTGASSYFLPRELIVLHMVDEVVRQQPPTDPLIGTVFERPRPTFP